MDNALITLHQIEKSYCVDTVRRSVLKNISLTIQQGEMIAIVGTSGSGKSTLMNMLGLLDKPDSGEYWLNGEAVLRLSDDQLAVIRNQQIGFVFQQFNLLPRLTAFQNVALPLTYQSLTSVEIQQRVHDVLARVGMADFSGHRPTQLSGGQQQRIAIARALVTNPRMILADEPTGSLDSVTGQSVMDLFKMLHQEGGTLIIVTHDEKIANQCSRVITLTDGEMRGARRADEGVK